MKTGTLIRQPQVETFLNEGDSRQSITDSKMTGLCLDRLSKGVGRWRYRTQAVDGRKRICLTVGKAPLLSLSQARELTTKLAREIAMGNHPNQTKKNLRSIPTITNFATESFLPYVERYKKSWKCDKGLLKNHVLPQWGKRHLDQITTQDVINLLSAHSRTHAPGSCNRLLILIRFMFNLSVRWKIITANPSTGVPLMREENKADRFLTQQEAEILYEAMKRSQNPMLQFIVPLLILTGVRKREALDAKWEDIDIERRQWRINVTKAGKPRFVPLSDGALKLLDMIPRFDCPWLLPNPKTFRPYQNIYYAWHSARSSVGLQSIKLHTLRHSFASFLVNSGRTLYEVQHLLGHTQIKTTARYSHLAQDTLLDATNAAGRATGLLIETSSVQKPIAIGYIGEGRSE
jgi:integrase